MQYESIELKDLYGCLQGGSLKVLCLDTPWGDDRDWVRPAVIVVPGGAYVGVSGREGETVAADFLSAGYQVCVLKYLCSPQKASYPEQICELGCAVDYLRKNAARLRINPKEIFVLGFSAGGHLVADFSNEYPSLREKTGIDLDCAVTAVGLCYPVINDHDQSFDNLLCTYDREEKQKLKEALRVDRMVGAHTPPTFLWTTAEDDVVPAHNTLDYALALSAKGVLFECHVYPHGTHGKSNGSPEVNDALDGTDVLSAWTKDMARFFRAFCKEAR